MSAFDNQQAASARFAEFCRLMEGGARLADAAARVGIQGSTVGKYRHRYEIARDAGLLPVPSHGGGGHDAAAPAPDGAVLPRDRAAARAEGAKSTGSPPPAVPPQDATPAGGHASAAATTTAPQGGAGDGIAADAAAAPPDQDPVTGGDRAARKAPAGGVRGTAQAAADAAPPGGLQADPAPSPPEDRAAEDQAATTGDEETLKVPVSVSVHVGKPARRSPRRWWRPGRKRT